MPKIIEDELLKDTVPFKVGKIYLYDRKSGIEYGMSYIKSNELDAQSDQVEVKSGNDNDTTYIIDKPRTVKFNIEEVIENQNITALKMGDGAIRKATTSVSGFHMPKNYTITTDSLDKIITLDEEPKEGEEITFKNNKTGKLIESAKITVDDTDKKKYVVTEDGLIEGDTILVGGFKFKGKETDKYFNLVSSSSVPELFAVVSVPIMKKDMEYVCDKQYIFDRCKLDASVNSSTDSDPKEVSNKHTLTILKPDGSEYLGTVYYKFPNA